MSERERLQQTIRDLHGCKSAYLRSEQVRQTFSDETVWEGTVDVFSRHGHVRAWLAYAWAHETAAGEKRYFAVLKLPPIYGAVDAVRASMMANHSAAKSLREPAALKPTLQVKTGDDGDVWARWIDENATVVPRVEPGTMTAAPGQNCAHCDARNRTWKTVPERDLPTADRMPLGELTYECRICGKTTREGRYKKVAGGGRFGFGPKAPPKESP
jgi:hypothetical protein